MPVLHAASFKVFESELCFGRKLLSVVSAGRYNIWSLFGIDRRCSCFRYPSLTGVVAPCCGATLLHLRSRGHEPVNSSDQANRAVTPHGEPLADASTPSRSQTMMSLTITTICMSLAVATLAEKAEVFVRDGGWYPDTSDLTVSAHSVTACSFNCVAQKEWRCGGFRYFTDRSCLLYKETILGTMTGGGAPSAEGNTGSDQPVIYRRRQPAPASACPGL